MIAPGADPSGSGGQGGAPPGRTAARDRQILPIRLDASHAFGPADTTANVAPKDASTSRANVAGAATAPADVRIVQGRADALDVTISAASPALRDRIAAAEGELRSDLGRIGAEVDRIHVELRRDGTALSALSAGGSASGTDTDQSLGNAGQGSQGQDGGSQPDPAQQPGDFRPDPSGPDADWLGSTSAGAGAGAGHSRPQEGQSDGRQLAERQQTRTGSQHQTQADADPSVRQSASTTPGRIDRYA
jgi:hypothetical protein